MRGCGDSPVISPRFFSAHRGATDDVRVAAAYIRENLLGAGQPLASVGWSNGATIMNK